VLKEAEDLKVLRDQEVQQEEQDHKELKVLQVQQDL
jgi:hypothetical protein